MEKLNLDRNIHNKKNPSNNIVFSPNFITGLLPPPNPLISRKNIPLYSPKFGKAVNYIKLNSFFKEDKLNENMFDLNKDKSQTSNNNTSYSEENFEKNCDINIYINSASMIEKLIYLKNEFTKENKINVENIVNLKKKNSDIPKKNKNIKSYYTPVDNKDTTLIFESRFESGNLLASFKLSENNYQLIVQNDTNTYGYGQWFFFRVSNVKKGRIAKFNILNLMKPFSLYNKGARIIVYSDKKSEICKIGWHRAGSNIKYYKNSLFKNTRQSKKFLRSLSFNYEFEYDDDTVYFANTMPYTYSELMMELNEVQKQDIKYDYVHRKTLCSTLAGNNLDYLTISTSSHGEKEKLSEAKQGIIFMARVHPGETVSSWMMKGLIKFLLGDSNEAVFLRKNFIIKIIPMMNPDGVISGNYRTSLAGCDLNRRWAAPNEILHPEIFYTKQMILKFASVRKIALVCDLHGHSGAHNIFMYGNTIKDDPSISKVFPYILSKLNPVFNFSQCTFTMPQSKLGTARINLFNELDSPPNIFTVESSFSGSNRGLYQNIHFDSSILMEMGRDLCLGFVSYLYSYDTKYIDLKNELFCDSATESKKIKKLVLIEKNVLINQLNSDVEVMEKSKKEKREKRKEKNEKNELNISDSNLKDSICSDNNSAGSDSEPSVDNLDNEVLMKLMPTYAKKKSKYYINIKILEKIIKKKVKLNIKKPQEKLKQSEIRNLQNDKQKIPTSIVKNENLKPKKIYKSISKLNLDKEHDQILESKVNKQLNASNPYDQSPARIPDIKFHNSIKTIEPVNNKKRDAVTQTEEIFFKMNWNFFVNKGFKIIEASKSNKLNHSSNKMPQKNHSIEKNANSHLNEMNKKDLIMNILRRKSNQDEQLSKNYNSTRTIKNNYNELFSDSTTINNKNKFNKENSPDKYVLIYLILRNYFLPSNINNLQKVNDLQKSQLNKYLFKKEEYKYKK